MKEANQEQAVTIRIGDWSIRPKRKTDRWKVSGHEGNFTLHQLTATRWRFVYGESSNRSQKRLTIDASGVEEAALKSIEVLFGGSTAGDIQRWDIADVLRHGWEGSNGEPYHKKSLKQVTKYFFEWCLENRIYYWDDLIERKTPMDYVASLAARRLERKSIGHYLAPLKRAAKWAKEKSKGDYDDWFYGFNLPPRIGLQLKYENQRRLIHLTIPKVLDLLEWLRGYPQALSLRPGIALQALCGLQLQESTRLTWDRVDLEDGTITIEEDRRRDPKTAGIKNPWRVRRLPLPGLVRSILKEAYRQRGFPSGPSLVVVAPTWKAYSSRIYRMFRAWDPTVQIPPSDFRNTLPTTAEEHGWMSVWVRRYFGHAPATEIERSYLAVQSEKGLIEGTDQFVERLKGEVVVHVEREIDTVF